MKGIKIYLIIVTTLLIIAIGFGVYAWYVLQSFKQSQFEVREAPQQQNDSQQEAPNVETESGVEGKPVVIDVSTLNDSQRSMLESFGITGDTITLTPTMLACAREAVGTARVDEIAGGSTPSPLEALKLLPCFKN